MECPLNDLRPLQAPYHECVGLRSVLGHDLTPLDREFIKGLTQTIRDRPVFESDQVSIVKQNEVSRSPVPDVFASFVEESLFDDVGRGAEGVVGGQSYLCHFGVGDSLKQSEKRKLYIYTLSFRRTTNLN